MFSLTTTASPGWCSLVTLLKGSHNFKASAYHSGNSSSPFDSLSQLGTVSLPPIQAYVSRELQLATPALAHNDDHCDSAHGFFGTCFKSEVGIFFLIGCPVLTLLMSYA